MTALHPSTGKPTFGKGRSGYTLLEVLLSMAIAVVLLLAMYVSLSLYLNSAIEGRDLTERATISRQILHRIYVDVSSHLGPIDPKMVGKDGLTGATTLASTDGTDTTDPASGTTTDATGATTGGTTGDTTAGTTSGTTEESTATTGSGPVFFNLGVQGSASVLAIYVNRVGREQVTIDTENPDTTNAAGSGLARITYWIAGANIGAPKGLARQEIKLATSQDLNSYPPNILNEDAWIIAPEVRDARFEYFDGVDWVESWDGAAVGSDGKTPIGPPMAIRITLSIGRGTPEEAAARQNRGNVEVATQYIQVIAIPTANSLIPQQIQGELDVQQEQLNQQQQQQQQQTQGTTGGGGGFKP